VGPSANRPQEETAAETAAKEEQEEEADRGLLYNLIVSNFVV